MEKAIKKAKEVGYKDWTLSNVGIICKNTHEIILDPLFWKALGKQQGWDEKYCTSGCGCEYPNGSGAHERDCVWAGKNEWKENMHSFIDHVAEGGLVETFFDDILK